jgi:hypothetical protein
LGEDLADLFHLIGFRLRSFALQIDPLHDPALGENVVAPGDAHAEPFGLEEMADFIEAKIGIGFAAEKFFQDFSRLIGQFSAHFCGVHTGNHGVSA